MPDKPHLLLPIPPSLGAAGVTRVFLAHRPEDDPEVWPAGTIGKVEKFSDGAGYELTVLTRAHVARCTAFVAQLIADGHDDRWWRTTELRRDRSVVTCDIYVRRLTLLERKEAEAAATPQPSLGQIRLAEHDHLAEAGVAFAEIARRVGIQPASLKRALARRRAAEPAERHGMSAAEDTPRVSVVPTPQGRQQR